MSSLRRVGSFSEAMDSWHRLLPYCSSNTVFLTPQWQWSWYQEMGNDGELFLLTWEKDGIQAIAPLLKRGNRITFIGERDVYDYCDFLVLHGVEREFFSSLLCWLAQEEWEELDFFSLPQGSPTLVHLPPLAEEAGYRVVKEVEDVCPGIQLPPTWDEYLSSLPKKHRHELKRKLRRLQDQGNFRWYSPSNASNLDGNMDDFFDLLHHGREDKRSFFTPKRSRFFRTIAQQMAERGFLRLFFLDMDGEKAASAMCFDYGPVRLLYNSAFNPRFGYYSVGLLLKVFCLKDAIEKGMAYFDFLRGPESYKYHLGAKDRALHRIRIKRQ